jgi:hypothetical protein
MVYYLNSLSPDVSFSDRAYNSRAFAYEMVADACGIEYYDIEEHLPGAIVEVGRHDTAFEVREVRDGQPDRTFGVVMTDLRKSIVAAARALIEDIADAEDPAGDINITYRFDCIDQDMADRLGIARQRRLAFWKPQLIGCTAVEHHENVSKGRWPELKLLRR